ncbi:MAG: ubiquinone/menaquinone biosynthesis methyltransferase, partial [Bdellovibrionales bacterium]
MQPIEGPRAEDIKNLFSAVADGYDRANDAMTLGLAHRWRKQLVQWSGVKPGDHTLDCATGTGDLAIELKRAVGPRGHVIGTDFCADMLKHAGPKAQSKNLDIDFQMADATQLPFADASFSVSTIAYGIRNVNDPLKALSEMARVVRPGGAVMVLETGDSPNNALKGFFDFYFRKVIPRIKGWVTGKR